MLKRSKAQSIGMSFLKWESIENWQRLQGIRKLIQSEDCDCYIEVNIKIIFENNEGDHGT